MGLSVQDWAQVAHVARFEFLAIAARSVAHVEVDSDPEIQRVVITVENLKEPVPMVSIEMHGKTGVIGGLVA